MIRLAMLGPYPLDANAIAGGVDAVVATLAGALARTGEVEVHVVTNSDPKGFRKPLGSELGSEGATVHVVLPHRLGRLMWYRRDVTELRRAIDRIRPDVLHAHGAGMVYVDAATGCGRPAVVTLHGVIFREAVLARGWRNWLRWQVDVAYERYCVRRARHLIAISPYVEREYRHLMRGWVYPIENPVDDRYFATAGEPEPGTIFCAARVIPRKGILELLAAFRLVAERLAQARLEIAGQLDADPAYAARCRTYVAEHGLNDRVRFLGALPADQMATAYTRAAVVALASHQETAPVTLAEAMAVGRPVVATDVGGVADMVADGRTGWVVPRGDVRALADALLRLLSDPAQARAMGAAGRTEAERRFRAEQVAAQTLEVYRWVMESVHQPDGEG